MVHKVVFIKYELYYVTNHFTVANQLLLCFNTAFCGWINFNYEHLTLLVPFWPANSFIIYFKRTSLTEL
jgi:hypothetical protein